MRHPFPTTISSTALDTFRSCPRRFYYENVRRLARESRSIHLHAGAAFAAGLEVARRSFLQGQKAETAIALGLQGVLKAYGDVEPDEENQHKSLERMLDAYVGYWEQWPLTGHELLPALDESSVEFSFAIPLPHTHPETGDPVLLTGRVDWITSFGGMVFVGDDKTSAYYQALQPEYWVLRSQLMCYIWAAQQSGIPAQGAMIRIASFGKAKTDYLEFPPFLVPPFRLERWYQQTLRDVTRMIHCWETDTWDYNFGDACNAFKGCPFKRLCLVDDADSWIGPLGFIVREPRPTKEIE